MATAEIFRFIGDLKIKGIVSAPQARLLEENLEERSVAYSMICDLSPHWQD